MDNAAGCSRKFTQALSNVPLTTAVTLSADAGGRKPCQAVACVPAVKKQYRRGFDS
jgi:hypothetical protein